MYDWRTKFIEGSKYAPDQNGWQSGLGWLEEGQPAKGSQLPMKSDVNSCRYSYLKATTG